MTIEEIWKPVPGYETDYSVSSLGRFKKNRTGRTTYGHLMKSNGYMYVHLSKDGVARNFRAHILVILAFGGPPSDDGLQVRHLDGNRTNNAADNLEWGTSRQNHYDCLAHGTHRGNYNGKFYKDHPNGRMALRDIEMLARMSPHFTQRQLARIFHISPAHVCRLLKEVREGRHARRQFDSNARKERQMGRQAP